MRNSDFRRLLEEDRPSGTQKPQETAEQRKEREDRRKQKKLASYKRWQERKAQLEAKYKKSDYRDRAKERREQKQKQEEEELKKYAHMSVEKTKFLGGDVEHTHLVKGLDFALLQRYKEELEREEMEKLEIAYEEAQAEKKVKDKAKKAKEEAEKDKPKFTTVVGRSIYNAAIGNALRRKEEYSLSNFVPGRMTFEFDLDPIGSELPTTIVHSKDHLLEIEERLSGVVPLKVSKRISRILTFLREGSKTLKSSKKAKAKAKRSAKTSSSSPKKNTNGGKHSSAAMEEEDDDDDDDDDDIFEDAGRDYVPTQDESSKSKAYFDTQKPAPTPSSSSSLPSASAIAAAARAAEAAKAALSEVNPKDMAKKMKMNKAKAAKRKIREPKRESLMMEFENDGPDEDGGKKGGGLTRLQPLEVDDEYAECYPTMSVGFETLGGEESDEDEAKGKGGPDANKSRKWGAKQRDSQKEAQKLDKEWGAIQKILKEKESKKAGTKKPSAKRQKILKGFVKK
uniref:RED-like N-terminal domain-containing protein n=1 Tax=Lotharella globosa TaxID=91324 RepID=A0A7S3YXM4_9EUKA